MFEISNAIRSTSTEDGAVILDLHHGRILGLNRMGSRIFEMLQSGLDQDQIAGEISKDCGVDVDYARADVLDFIKTLHEHDVLRASHLD
jgi:Coenzyme PQQ synthesis protein D (PqqD)